MLSFDEFKKMELRVATVKEVLDHPDADKLYVLKVDLGDKEKQIVAGLKLKYKKEQLVGRQIVIVDNLEPVVLRGVESQGMLLAASDESVLAFLTPEKAVANGSKVK